MNISPQADSRTRAFARVLGPLLGILSVSVLLRTDNLMPIVSEFTASAVWPWVTGVFVTAAGIAVVTFHRTWRGATAFMVSSLGWMILVKGILLLIVPSSLDSVAHRMVSTTAAVPVVYSLLALVSLYLIYAGWRSGSDNERPTSSRTSGKSPHATA